MYVFRFLNFQIPHKTFITCAYHKPHYDIQRLQSDRTYSELIIKIIYCPNGRYSIHTYINHQHPPTAETIFQRNIFHIHMYKHKTIGV